MIVSMRGSVVRIFTWQWKLSLLFVSVAALVAALHHFELCPNLKLPVSPVAIVGGALGIFVSFRTNSAYDRWWEGLKLWGRMINSSRHFATQVTAYFVSHDEMSEDDINHLKKDLVYRHIAYVHALRCLLRVQDPFEDDEFLAAAKNEDLESLKLESNLTHALLQKQTNQLTGYANKDVLNEFRLQSLDRTVAALLDIQGGCERIKKTPMPVIYGFIAHRLIQFYGCIFPLAIVSELGWYSVPISLFVCMAFALINEAGRVLEDPFTMFYNGLPLSAISRMIEVNLRHRLGEKDVPPMLKADEKGVLM